MSNINDMSVVKQQYATANNLSKRISIYIAVRKTWISSVLYVYRWEGYVLWKKKKKLLMLV